MGWGGMGRESCPHAAVYFFVSEKTVGECTSGASFGFSKPPATEQRRATAANDKTS